VLNKDTWILSFSKIRFLAGGLFLLQEEPRDQISPKGRAGLPFCPEENWKIRGLSNWWKRRRSNWLVRVVNNKYPFAPIHEVIVHSPDHHKNFDELPLSQSELVFKAYRQRFQTHQDKGQVCIFKTMEKWAEKVCLIRIVSSQSC